jgi:RNA polymerase sigma factor (sigma-70 family)
MAARPVPAVDRPTARADEACAALYSRYGGEILRYCRRRLREPADAEDVTQQVFVRVYGALLRGERVRLPRHWLLRIARNECRRFVARRSRVQEVGFDEAIDVPPEEEQAQWSPAEIRRALDELVPTQRQALVMRELEGRPYAEIARELRLTVSAVETLLFRARRSLREQLDGVLACGAAERALSLELDGRLPEAEKPGLRAHLRGCEDCRQLARRSRAQRHALRTLLPFPVQGQLASLVGGGSAAGGAAVGTGAVAKALTLLAAGAVSSTVGLTVALPALAPERAPTKAVVPSGDAETATAKVRVQAVPSSRLRATTTPSAVTGAPATSAPVAGTTPVTSATTTVTTEPAVAPGGAPATATAAPEPVTGVVSTVEKTVGTVGDTVDTLLPSLQLPEPQLPPVQPPPLPVEPPPLPTVPKLPPLDPSLPDLPG